ncbi:hypothetical protein B0I37DRAFT_371795 [Chaetomium sp. MPI-CAGE-AT-0009]|nr:hypothetical protein B0I37DRAFT_371795 [Chaetomium sp. MPI-CAGE-AT-0009]
MGRYSDQWDWYECEWCRVRGNWNQRPCLSLHGTVKSRFQKTVRARRVECERVRMENAAKRNKTLPNVYRRAMRAAAAEAEAEAKHQEVPNWSIRANTEGSVVGRLSELGEGIPVETGTEEAEESPLPVASKSTPKPKHDHEVDAKKGQQRQAKSCIGLKGTIDEGVGLASDDDDVARIYAANRKAWPRGQEPIAADATAEDKEIAELVRRGIIGVEDLRVDHDDIGGDVCLYTVRCVEARKKGRKGSKGTNSRQQGVRLAEPAPLCAESDWWCLDDEAYAQLLSDGGSELGCELVDWSEASSFVHVD